MNEDKPDLQAWIDPQLEARIVAWVLGEASAFETAELARILNENPEAAVFKRRIEAVNGLVTQAVRPDTAPLRLAPERRNELLEKLGKQMPVSAAPPVAIRQNAFAWSISKRRLLTIAACLTLCVSLAGLIAFGLLTKGNVGFSQDTRIHGDLQTISSQIKLYQAMNGTYPPSLQALVTRPEGAKQWRQLLEKVPADPWQHEYQYIPPGKEDAGSFDLFSLGPDGRPNTKDDSGRMTEAGRSAIALYAPKPSRPLATSTPDPKQALAQIESQLNATQAKLGDAESELADAKQVSDSLTAKNSELESQLQTVTETQDKSERHVMATAPTPPPASGIADPSSKAELLAEAEEYAKMGRYDRAMKRFDQVLELDPYNADARKGQERVNEERANYAVDAYNETRSRMVWQKDRDSGRMQQEQADLAATMPAAEPEEAIADLEVGRELQRANKPRPMTTPDLAERITSSGNARVEMPAMPETPATEVVPNQMAGMGGFGGGSGMGGGGRSNSDKVAETGKDSESKSQIESKFVEILQNNEKDLDFDWVGGQADKPATFTGRDESGKPVTKFEGHIDYGAPITPANTPTASQDYNTATRPLYSDNYEPGSADRGNEGEARSLNGVPTDLFDSGLYAGNNLVPVRRAGGDDTGATNKKIVSKLDEIVIPQLEFRDATPREALEFLKQKSRELDASEPDRAKRGVDIKFDAGATHYGSAIPGAGESAEPAIPGLSGDATAIDTATPQQPRITLSLRKIPLREALRYVSDLAGMKTKIGEDGVEVVPQSEPTDSVVTKEYAVPPEFIGGLAKSSGDQRATAREFLEAQGITFPQGASATYLPDSGRLVVRNTAENLDLVDQLTQMASESAVIQPTKQQILEEITRNEIAASDEPFSTFSLHVSDVSFRLAQAALAKGEMPDAESIRPEEFYNAFDYCDPAPGAGEDVACKIEQSAHPVLQQRNLVRIAMKVGSTGRGAGQPLRLTVLLDTSGSMEREDRAASVRRAMEVLASLLAPGDAVTLVGFARQPRLLADQLPGDQAGKLVDLVKSTPSEGGTNLEEAIKLASELAQKHRVPAAQNRIVLLTDGAANLGNADPARLATMIENLRQQGIAFDACGVGADGLNDEILEALTRKGDGRYYFLDQPEDADAGFARQLAGAFRPAAQNVKVQVRFNPARVGNYRLIGFEKHRLKKEDFRNDKVDAAELAAEEAAVALYQVEVLPEGEGELGEAFMRYRDASNGRMIERSWTIPFESQARTFDQASASMQLAGTAAMLAEKLHGGAMANLIELDAVAPIANGLRGHYPQQPRVQDLVTMFEQMRRMSPPK